MTSSPIAAVAISEAGGPDVLKKVRLEQLSPSQDEVLVKVEAAGVNRVDVRQRQGLVPLPANGAIPGLEVSGTVVAPGVNGSRWKRGDRVCALVPGGGYATHVLAPEELSLPVPKRVSFVQAAALPQALFAAWFALLELGGLKSGQTVLVHAGASGVGTVAIQLARAIGATVIATAGSYEKCDVCERLGALRAINYRVERSDSVVKEVTGGRGVDLLVDVLGGPSISGNIACLSNGGRLICLGFMQGDVGELDLSLVARKRIAISGGFLRDVPRIEKAQIARELEARVWPLVEKGEIRPIVDKEFPLEEAADAHRRLEERANTGKIVLRCVQ